jgi:hypothetical protein
MFQPFLLRQSCDTFNAWLRQLYDERATDGKYDERVRYEDLGGFHLTERKR